MAQKQVTVGGIDMHAMVNQLRQEKQAHDQSVENLTLKELREKVSVVVLLAPMRQESFLTALL